MISQQRATTSARILGVPAQEPGQVALQPGEKRRVADDPVFDDLGQAGAKFAGRQRVQRPQIAEDKTGLMKGADQVLAGFEIDADFAADRAVHLRQQGGGHLHERDAAQINRGDKSGQIAHDAAAQGDDEGFAFQAVRGQLVAGGLDHFEALGSFAMRHANQPRFKSGGTERGQNRFGVEARHAVVRDHRATAAEFQFCAQNRPSAESKPAPTKMG